MSSPMGEQTVPYTRRSRTRKSIATVPSRDGSFDLDDKENIEVNETTVNPLQLTANAPIASSKKSRSKSLGPGGLDALREHAGNRRKTAAGPPKSILKPSIPLSPLKEIPTRKTETPEKRPATPSKSPKSPSPSKGSATAYHLDHVSHDHAIKQAVKPDQVAVAQDEQKEAIKKQREARRKSLANRRVSFAPEATLHTWDVVEYMQDATTSSASNDSTRRASTASQFNATENAEPDESPSTPPEQVEESPIKASPAHQRDLHQKKRRRRSSGGPGVNFSDPDEVWSSSPNTGSSTGEGHEAIESSHRPRDGSDSSHESNESIPDQPQRTSPREELQSSPTFKASAERGQSNFELDQDGDVTMEMAGDEVTTAFKPWGQLAATGGSSEYQTDESPNPVPMNEMDSENNQEEISMDITKAVGQILPSEKQQNRYTERKATSRRQSMMNRRKSDEESAFGEETMDFTTAIGGIEPDQSVDTSQTQLEQNEELSMEFTSVFGGIKRQPNKQEDDVTRTSAAGPMEMTTALGGIQSDPVNFTPRDNETKPMDMTMAIGGIVTGNSVVEEIVSARSPLRSNKVNKVIATVSTSETGSPSISSARQPGRPQKNAVGKTSSTPTKSPKSPGTPRKQITPKPERPTTPGKTPPSKNVMMRNPSPKRLFHDAIKDPAKSPNGFARHPGLLDADKSSQQSTSKVVLAPKIQINRRTSGIGIDKDGLGSPQVAAKLDRRVSITDQADVFAPQNIESRGVRFEDPRSMELDVIRHREEDERRESGQFIMEQEMNAARDENDVTANLKDMIEKMTPKKGSSKGRKSLAVGSAKGLLGKRPAELDEDDEDGTLPGYQGRSESPVKKVRLQGPPTKLETTGKRSLGLTSGNMLSTPIVSAALSDKTVSTPKDQARFIDAEAMLDSNGPLPMLGEQGASLPSTDNERISLQDFLTLTNIRFMELNTTKRRHTVVPGSARKGANKDHDNRTQSDSASQFEDCVVAGACTVPMLELYQHSCRELKKYIAEGRSIVREIESDTLDDNPPLFRVYQSAAPHERHVMDNQFKNMKFNARLLSKGMWYEWRMKLLEGLREGLNSVASGMDNDGDLLVEQEEAIASILPSLTEEQVILQEQYSELRARSSELADCDQEELKEARLELMSVREEINAGERKIRDLSSREKEARDTIENVKEAKTERVQSIKEAHKVREEYRGWSTSEVSNLKSNVAALEAKYGWAITSASSTSLTMTYRQQLRLFFDVASFLPRSPDSQPSKAGDSPISLAYMGDSHHLKPSPLTTERRFFLQLMQAHLHGLSQGQTQVRDMLQFISAAWDKACAVERQARRLNTEFVTNSSISADDHLSVKASILLHDVQTRVDVVFDVQASIKDMQIVLKTASNAKVVYGERFREDKMNQFLRGKVVGSAVDGSTTWTDVARDLKNKLESGGKKI